MTKDQKIHELKKEIESLNLKLKDVNLPLYDRHHLIKQIRLKEIDVNYPLAKDQWVVHN